jgi:hypothetical protein
VGIMWKWESRGDLRYVLKAIEAINNIMFRSSTENAIRTIEYLNANKAILSSANI